MFEFKVIFSSNLKMLDMINRLFAGSSGVVSSPNVTFTRVMAANSISNQ